LLKQHSIPNLLCINYQIPLIPFSNVEIHPLASEGGANTENMLPLPLVQGNSFNDPQRIGL